ncbi:PH domain-containing protein [Nannocystaceae bacterium ST9]
MANPRFHSKVDGWLAAILIALVLVAIVVPILLYAVGDPYAWTGLISAGFIFALVGGLVFPLYYELEADTLLIRSGVLRSRIRYADIQRVVPSRRMLSSPALSLDRLHVDAGNRLGPLISPKDKAGFLAALAAKTPQLIREGDRLAPRA